MTSKHLVRSSLQRAARSQRHGSQQCRSFTTTQRAQAAAQPGSGSARGMIARQLGQAKTMQSRISGAKGSDVPNDLGLMADTLVIPKRSDLPPFFSSQFKRRIRIELKAWWQKASDFGGILYQTKWLVKKDPITRKSKREPMQLADRYLVARELHRELYTALAQGDRTRISEIACSGLQNALKARLDHRKAVNGPKETWGIEYKGWTPKSEKTPWLLQALMPPRFKSTRIRADRCGSIPIGRDGRMRQVFVQIRSEQTLDKNDGSEPRVKEVDEIVIIQQMKIDDAVDKWMIWGTVSPSTPKQIDAILKSEPSELGFMDRLATSLPK